ncbi:hypothetical protein GEMRC1_000201 [Eukaryota sp. GEM-RC1]
MNGVIAEDFCSKMDRRNSSYASTKASSRAVDAEDQRRINVHRASCLLTSHFLSESGFFSTSAQLETELQHSFPLDQHELADNLNSTTPDLFIEPLPSQPKPSQPLQPLLNFSQVPEEMKESLASVLPDISASPTTLHFKDIIGLVNAKKILCESIVLPNLRPELFTFTKPPSSVLLYGAPGCGKTLLAKSVATESKCAFISLAGSSLVSKWRGESEKVLRSVFAVARANRPCVLFIDEIDAIFPKSSDHEASRRLSAELLTQIDGITSSMTSSGSVFDLFFLAATNKPMDLEDPLLRRFHRKVFVPPPSLKARKSLITRQLGDLVHNQGVLEAVDQVAMRTQEWPASDLVFGVSESLMYPIRRQLFKENSNIFENLVGSDDEEGKAELRTLHEEAKSLANSVKNINYCGRDLETAFVNIQPSYDLKLSSELANWKANDE